MHQQVWELKPTGGRRTHYTNNEGEAASALGPAKGFTELCFRGPLRHVGDTSLLVKETMIDQKLQLIHPKIANVVSSHRAAQGARDAKGEAREGQMVSLRPGRIELMPSGRGECLEEPGAPFWPVISH